jgi:hypothetical protein
MLGWWMILGCGSPVTSTPDTGGGHTGHTGIRDTTVVDTHTGPVDGRTGRAFRVDLADGGWSPTWAGEAISASLSPRPFVLSLRDVTPEALSLRLEDDSEDPCRLSFDTQAAPWDDPSFVTSGHGNASRIDLGGPEQPVIVESSEASAAFGSVDLTLSGTLAADAIDGFTVSFLVSAQHLDWTGLGSEPQLCTRATAEGTPCVPCGADPPGRCLPMQVTDLPAPLAVAGPPTAGNDCE